MWLRFHLNDFICNFAGFVTFEKYEENTLFPYMWFYVSDGVCSDAGTEGSC